MFKAHNTSTAIPMVVTASPITLSTFVESHKVFLAPISGKDHLVLTGSPCKEVETFPSPHEES